MSGRNLIIIIVLVLVVAAGFIMIARSMKSSNLSTSAPSQTVQNSSPVMVGSSSPNASSSGAMSQNIINISSNGFSPSTVTIKVGDTVTWMNKDSAPHQVNSDVHPTHLLYPPLNTIGLLNPGEKKSLSFPTAGTFKFHDHLNPQFTGSVVVQ